MFDYMTNKFIITFYVVIVIIVVVTYVWYIMLIFNGISVSLKLYMNGNSIDIF